AAPGQSPRPGRHTRSRTVQFEGHTARSDDRIAPVGAADGTSRTRSARAGRTEGCSRSPVTSGRSRPTPGEVGPRTIQRRAPAVEGAWDLWQVTKPDAGARA